MTTKQLNDLRHLIAELRLSGDIVKTDATAIISALNGEKSDPARLMQNAATNVVSSINIYLSSLEYQLENAEKDRARETDERLKAGAATLPERITQPAPLDLSQTPAQSAGD